MTTRVGRWRTTFCPIVESVRGRPVSPAAMSLANFLRRENRRNNFCPDTQSCVLQLEALLSPPGHIYLMLPRLVSEEHQTTGRSLRAMDVSGSRDQKKPEGGRDKVKDAAETRLPHHGSFKTRSHVKTEAAVNSHRGARRLSAGRRVIALTASRLLITPPRPPAPRRRAKGPWVSSTFIHRTRQTSCSGLFTRSRLTLPTWRWRLSPIADERRC